MKQLEREWKAAQDDATDDEVNTIEALILTDLTLRRTMCCHLLTLMIQSKVLTTDLALSLRREAEHTSRLTGNLKTMSNGSCSINFVPPLSRKTRARMTPSRTSLAALLDTLDPIVRKRSRITISTVLQMLHTISRGRHRHLFDCRRLRSFLTIKRLCLCSLPTSRQHSLFTTTTPRFKAKQPLGTRISLRMLDHLLLISTSPGSRHQCPSQAHRWLRRPKRRLVGQRVRRSRA